MVVTGSSQAPGLADLFPPEAILVGLTGRTRDQVIAELVGALVRLGRIAAADAQTALDAVLAREKIGSDPLYNGLAFPHCRVSFTDGFVGALGVEPRGVPFDAADGEPVRSVFLFLAPLDRREELYDILGRIMALGADKSRRLQLQGCRSAEAVHHLLREWDVR